MQRILKRKVKWPMETSITPDQHEINRWIYKLDEVTREYEAKWGISRLPNLVSPATGAKWDRHLAKLDAAIVANDLPLVRDLAQGTIRGYAALEAEAITLGAARLEIDTWDVRSPETGNRYRITKTVTDALGAAQSGVAVYSLDEIARILDKRDLSALHPVVTPREKIIKEAFDFGQGDEILW